MNRYLFTTFGIVAALAIGCAPGGAEPQSPDAAAPSASAPAPAPTVVAQAAAPSGTFVAAEHPTSGAVRVVSENGARYLEFDQAFSTDSGPDLFVVLHRAAQPPVGGFQEADYVTLAPLQTTSGTQRYALPADLDLAEFGSVAVWCRMFNATFGYATLSS